ncbi:sulfotransferase domain-containing protein [Oxynema sp. CENA135]|uniref:sulfotransferase domain-containing protein n=1 Tax=Oxynema sp. CENA135 TaxID=984206 RepID=UPI00190E1BEA|nr:sulfotransferase domain-containing protein [Oxynema sp. CENA135]MBK4729296.1 sulfotransferase domain-containing protein [Oxynema sp. CENA135]
MPDFLIIGAQKCGTTSLYHYLVQHPKIIPARQKEVHFFDLNFDRGLEWYAAQFFPESYEDGRLTGEASPYYVFHPLVAKRVYESFPKIKLILLLRNPIDRAWSHYHHEVRWGFESLSFEEAIASEPKRLAGEEEKMREDPSYYSYNHQHYTYLARGIYAEQIAEWLQYFDRDRLLILKSEELSTHPDEMMAETCAFLGVEAIAVDASTKYNSGEYSQIPEKYRQELAKYFHPHNRRLKQEFGIDFYSD